MKLITLDFNDLPKLSPETKELIGLGVWSMYELKNKQYLIRSGGTCACHSNKMTFFLIDKDGSFIEIKDESFYNDRTNLINAISFQIPKSISDRYLQIKL